MSAARKKTRLIKLVDKRSVSWEQALQEYLLWKNISHISGVGGFGEGEGFPI